MRVEDHQLHSWARENTFEYCPKKSKIENIEYSNLWLGKNFYTALVYIVYIVYIKIYQIQKGKE